MMLFENLPRDRPRLKRMTIENVGLCPWEVHFVCAYCGYDHGWRQFPNASISDIKKGMPCPKCNDPEDQRK